MEQLRSLAARTSIWLSAMFWRLGMTCATSILTILIGCYALGGFRWAIYSTLGTALPIFGVLLFGLILKINSGHQ